MIYVGSFSKTLFPSLRLGFLVLPPDLRERVAIARRSIDLQPPALNQHVLARFIADGHYDAHLREMRVVYRERLDALLEAAERYCGGALRMRPVITGLHAVGDLTGVPDDAVSAAAAARGLEVTALSSYYKGASRRAERPRARLRRGDAGRDRARDAAARRGAGARPGGGPWFVRVDYSLNSRASSTHSPFGASRRYDTQCGLASDERPSFSSVTAR